MTSHHDSLKSRTIYFLTSCIIRFYTMTWWQYCVLSEMKVGSIGKGKVHPCTGRTGHRESRGIALLFHDHGTRRFWGVSHTPRPPFTLGEDPVPIVQDVRWTPGPFWTGAENLAQFCKLKQPQLNLVNR